MTEIKRPIAHAGIGIEGNFYFVQAASDHLPVFDRHELAVVFRPQLRQ
jgi:hypothetical protein